MLWLRIVASVTAGLSLSACAQSALVQSSDLAKADAVRPSVVAASPAAAVHSSYGVASYYSYPGRTASGERYDPKQLTAAHRTLPFGTKLQVTNVKSGHSVIVRVNDRGPFIRGRVVDVSYAAARQLDLLHSGTAKVKVDVLQQ
jgi:rare lipoprotein A